MKNAWKFVVAGVLAVLLVGLAYVVAVRQSVAVPPPHDFSYFLATNALAVVIILVTPAFGLFILQRSGASLPGWLSFWTFAYLVYLLYIGASLSVGTGSGFIEGQRREPRHLPWIDWVLVVWWGLDVVLAFTVGGTTGPLRLGRGALHLILFAVLLVRWLESDAWYLHALGILMVLAVLIFAIVRVVVVEFDRDSLAGRLFIGAFDVIDRFVPWHRLPTPLAVLNLAAFREVLRAKNLHNTSDIPVTRPENQTPIPRFEPRFLYERELDGHYNDLTKPAMGSASTNEDTTHDSMYLHQEPSGGPVRPERPAGVCLPRGVPVADTQSARGQHAGCSRAGSSCRPRPSTCWRRRGFSSRRTTGSTTASRRPTTRTGPPRRRRHLARVPDASPPHPARPDPGLRGRAAARGPRLPLQAGPADLRQRRVPLVGRVADLRQQPRDLATAAVGPRGQASFPTASSSSTATSSRSTPATRDRPVRLHRQLVARAEPAAHPLHPRAQCHLRSATAASIPTGPATRSFDVARLVNAALMAKIHTIEWTPAILGHPALAGRP